MDLIEIPGSQEEDDVVSALSSESKETRIAARRKRVMMKIEADRRAAKGQEPTSVWNHVAS